MQPLITSLVNGTRFHFKDYQLTITTQRVKLHSNGNITGELDIETSAPSYPSDIFFGNFNFLDLVPRQRLAGYLEKRYGEPPWMEVLETVVRHTVTSIRRGDQMVEVNSLDEVPDVQFDVFPLLQTGQPTTLFGDGATGKSYLALVMAIAERLPWYDNDLGLKVSNDHSTDVVWLDYETCEDDFRRRLNKLIKGMNLGEVTITYRRCSQVLADEIDELAPLVNMREPGLVVIDSIGAACAGDLHGSEAPTRFFNAIRRFSGSKLLIFHTNKDKELYGNRFFWNFSRHAWEVKKQQAEGDDIVSVGLYHRKANETKLFQPMAFNLLFQNGNTVVERADIADIPELSRGLPIKDKVRALLRYGPRTTKEISDEIDEGEASVKTVLNRYKNTFTKVDNKWGLLTQEMEGVTP